jgi:hypothetical protein
MPHCGINVAPMRKKALFICLILGSAVFFNVLCPQLCSSDLLGLDFTQDEGCGMSSHFPAYIGASLSTSVRLPLLGVFLSTNTTFIPEEFVLSLFRPPRLLA